MQSVLKPRLLEKAVAGGLRRLFLGFETLSKGNLRAQHKVQNLHKDYDARSPPARARRDDQRQLRPRHDTLAVSLA